MLCSASSSVVINGARSDSIGIAQGVRQGDPLSPALFILAMDALHGAIQWAKERGLLGYLGLHANVPRASIFADDAVVLLKPTTTDCQVISTLLQLLGDAWV